MHRPTRIALLVLATVSAFLAVASPWRSVAAGREDPHLVYRSTYAEALLEGRVRNVPVFVTRHKDD